MNQVVAAHVGIHRCLNLVTIESGENFDKSFLLGFFKSARFCFIFGEALITAELMLVFSI